MLVAGIGDVVLNGTLSLLPRPVFAALLGVSLVFLLHDYLLARRRSDCSTARRRR